MQSRSKIYFNPKIFQYTLAACLLLYFGKSFFIPLSVSLLISFVLYPVCAWLERHRFGRGAAVALSISLLVIAGMGVGYLFFMQIIDFSAEWPQLEKKLVHSLLQLSDYINLNFAIRSDEQLIILKDALRKSSFQMLGFFPKVVYSSGIMLVMAILIPIISALILFHRQRLVFVLSSFFPSEEAKNVRMILSLSVANYYNFIKGMLIVYFTVGLLNSIGLFFLGIPYSFLFGYIAAIMTFIPYAGIIISSLLPITVAWVTYDSIWYPVGVVAIFTVVQYLEANVIFPLAVSSRLKVNTLVTLAAILIGGIIWGAAGMILFIPYLGIMKVISDKSENLRPLSVLLDSKELATDDHPKTK